MRRAGRALVLAAAFVSGAANGQTVQRCESPDGKVTYSNTACPPGTQAVRRIEAEPPPAAVDQKAARERTQRYAREVQRLEDERKRQEEKAARTQAAAEERTRRKAAECRKLEARVEDAREAFERATLAKRQEADRKLRRAREQYESACGKS
jgi:predicted ribosome quality control (RQC) complex YloA/Tae2 family protein